MPQGSDYGRDQQEGSGENAPQASECLINCIRFGGQYKFFAFSHARASNTLREREVFVKFKTQRPAHRAVSAPVFSPHSISLLWIDTKNSLTGKGRNHAPVDSCLRKLRKSNPETRKKIVP